MIPLLTVALNNRPSHNGQAPNEVLLGFPVRSMPPSIRDTTLAHATAHTVAEARIVARAKAQDAVETSRRFKNTNTAVNQSWRLAGLVLSKLPRFYRTADSVSVSVPAAFARIRSSMRCTHLTHQLAIEPQNQCSKMARRLRRNSHCCVERDQTQRPPVANDF